MTPEQHHRQIEEIVGIWHMAPEDGAQIIQVEYGTCEDGETIYRRVIDRSVPETTYYEAEWPDELEFEPWNGAADLCELTWREI